MTNSDEIEQTIEEDKLMTIEEVASILKVKRSTVSLYINREFKPLPVIYLTNNSIRISTKDFKVWLETLKEENGTN